MGIGIYSPPLAGGEHKGRVVGYPPLLACRSKFINNGRVPLPPRERKSKIVVLFFSPEPNA